MTYLGPPQPQPREYPLPYLAKDIVECPVVQVGDYDFRAFSTGERGTVLSPELIQEIKGELFSKIGSLDIPFSSFVSLHTTGAMWAILAAAEFMKPLHLFTLEPSQIEGQKHLVQRTGYNSRSIYSPNMSEIDDCLIIDDVLSSGSTLCTIVAELREAGSNPTQIVCIIDKAGKSHELEQEIGVPVLSLIDARQVLSGEI